MKKNAHLWTGYIWTSKHDKESCSLNEMLATSSPAQPLSVSKEDPLIEASMPTSSIFRTSESHNMSEFFDRLSNLQLKKRLLHGLSTWVSQVMLYARRKNWGTQNLLQQNIFFFSVRKKHPPFIKVRYFLPILSETGVWSYSGAETHYIHLGYDVVEVGKAWDISENCCLHFRCTKRPKFVEYVLKRWR
jgi:hypothetical protein